MLFCLELSGFSSGKLITLHYSVSALPNTGYRPRIADGNWLLVGTRTDGGDSPPRPGPRAPRGNSIRTYALRVPNTLDERRSGARFATFPNTPAHSGHNTVE